MAHVRRRCWSSPGAETLVTEYAYAVGEFRATGRRITDCGALEQTSTVEMEQTLLGMARPSVDELSELTRRCCAAADEEPETGAIGDWKSAWV
jgi:hypothetical protein